MRLSSGMNVRILECEIDTHLHQTEVVFHCFYFKLFLIGHNELAIYHVFAECIFKTSDALS